MNKELIFIGGSKGVGKTSLVRAASLRLNFDYISTGERFGVYHEEFDRKFIQELIDLEGRTIIDTHYATSSSKEPYDFHIGIDEEYQMQVRLNSKYRGKIILIEASPEIVIERRKNDGSRRRCLELAQIIKENNFNSRYSKIYSSCLNIPYKVLKNEDLSIEDAAIKLIKLIKN